MAAELSLLSLNQLQNLAQLQQLNPNSIESGSSWMWNSKKRAVVQEENDDDSWEVRAFAEDTGNVMGTTWPPRSYTCTFCRREFRSAQALGGHMNVHRRDRARLHQTHTSTTSSNSSSSSTLMIPTQEFVANSGLCFLYQLPNPNGVFTPKITNSPIDLPSTLLSISSYFPNNMVSPPHQPPPINYSLAQTTTIKAESSSIPGENNGSNCDIVNENYKKDSAIEELDLELRLGH